MLSAAFKSSLRRGPAASMRGVTLRSATANFASLPSPRMFSYDEVVAAVQEKVSIRFNETGHDVRAGHFERDHRVVQQPKVLVDSILLCDTLILHRPETLLDFSMRLKASRLHLGC